MTKELELLRDRLLASARHYQGASLDPINRHCKTEMLATADLLREAAATLAKTQEGVTDILRSRPCCPAGSANCDIEVEKLVSLFAQQKAPEGECSCPSGDGSLRWPCPQHPASDRAAPDGGFDAWYAERWPEPAQYEHRVRWRSNKKQKREVWEAALRQPAQVGAVPDVATLASVLWCDYLTNEQVDKMALSLHGWLTSYYAMTAAQQAEQPAVELEELRALAAKWLEDASGGEGYNYTTYEEGRIAEKRRCAAHLITMLDGAKAGKGEDNAVLSSPRGGVGEAK